MEPLHIDLHKEYDATARTAYFTVVLRKGKHEFEEFGLDGPKDMLEQTDSDVLDFIRWRDGNARQLIQDARAERSEIIIKRSGIDDEIALMKKQHDAYKHAWNATGSNDFVKGLLKRFRLPEDVKQELRALPKSDTLTLYERMVGHADFVTKTGSANINIYSAIAKIPRGATVIDFLQECKMKNADREMFELLASPDGCELLANSDRAAADAAITKARRCMATLADDDPKKLAVEQCVRRLQESQQSAPVTDSVSPKPRCPGPGM